MNRRNEHMFVGHLIYPDTEKANDTLFVATQKYHYTLSFKGQDFKCTQLSLNSKQILKSIGFRIQETPVTKTDSRRKLLGIFIHATRKSGEILVTIRAKTNEELADNIRKIAAYLDKETGTIGRKDIFTKMEEC